MTNFLLAVIAAPTLLGIARRLLGLSLLLLIFIAAGVRSGMGIVGIIIAVVVGFPAVMLVSHRLQRPRPRP